MASQELGNPYLAPQSAITPGEPLSRSMGQYAKGHSFLNEVGTDLTPARPTSPIQAGGMSRHARQGGLSHAYPKGGK